MYYKVGTILADLGQRQPAGQSFAESMRLYEALAAEAPNDPEIQDGLARALSRRREEPRAIAIWEKLVRTDDPRYQADLGYAYNDVGLRAGEGGDRAKELEFLRKALLIRERLVQLRPDDPEARVGLSASLNNIAIRLKVERNAEKLDLLRRAVEQCEAAYRLRPADSLGQQFLAIQLDNLASFARQAGATEEELAARRRRVDVLDRRARDNPTVPGNDTAFVQGFSDLVDALRTAGRPAEALQVAERGASGSPRRPRNRPSFSGRSRTYRSLRIPSPWPDPRPRRRGPERRPRGGGGGQGSAAARPRGLARPAMDADGPADRTTPRAGRLQGTAGPDGRAGPGRRCGA